MHFPGVSAPRPGRLIAPWLPLLAAACLPLASGDAFAQPAPSANDTGTAPVVEARTDPDAGVPASPLAAAAQPPTLIADAAAVYPAAAEAERVEGRVLLRLTIDVHGNVVEIEVLEPAGHGFDEAARVAAMQLRFEPARRNGEPVPSKIRYPVEFRLAAPVPAAGAIEGRLLLDGNGPAGAPVVTSGETTQLDPAPPKPVVAALPPTAAVEVSVAGVRSEGERLRQSAAAVSVIDTRKAQRQTADLGEVLARSQGIAVRRYGGLGTQTRFSLNGLYDEQVRFFMDDIPLEIAGFTLGVSNVPVNLVERVEVYRGVVPVRFGADALGGAVNLVTDQRYRPHLAASYQVGSYGTHRVTLDGRYRHEPTGFITGVTSFFDTTKNNYHVDVEVTDDKGQIVPATVPRFHDAYTAFGATLEAGVVDRPWAKRLIVRGLLSTYEKQLQHNIVMKVPYGGVHYGETVSGANLRYDVAPLRNLELEAVASYAYRSIDYSDKSNWVYDWYGVKVRRRLEPGEVDTRAHDQTEWQHNVYGRALAVVSLTPEHKLRASFSPAFATRRGDERLQADPNARDPLTAQRDLFTFVSGIEYEISLLRDRIANILFVKDYYYQANSEEPLPGGIYRKRANISHSQGVGDSLRVRIMPWLYAKASYEYATRLPSSNELFGNGAQIHANLELEPEVSHNANLGPRLELTQTPLGDLTVDINAFWRHSDKLIILLGNDRYFTYQNVYLARGMGLENALSWSAPKRWLSLDGTFTWQDTRNQSTEGTFKRTKNDRIPNRPYMFASWGARGRLPAFTGEHDAIEPFYNGRYVHSFFRGWESQGMRDLKQDVDSQVTHSVGVSWSVQRDYASVTTTFEIDNLTDARVYDNYGVQRPGRAFYVKLTGDLR